MDATETNKTDATKSFKVGDKVRVAFRFDRLIVTGIVQYRDYTLVQARFESGFGQYSGPSWEFCHGWRRWV